MKYNGKEFTKAVQAYKRKGKELGKKCVLLILPFENEHAYYSLAPLSMALHELKTDLRITVLTGKKSKNLEILERIWQTSSEMKAGEKNTKAKALREFVAAVNRKAGNKKFEKYLKKPDLVLEAKVGGFFKGDELVFEFNKKWFKKFKEKELLKASAKVLKYTFNVKRNEIFSIGFELVPEKKELELPLEDYLDNFAIARAMTRQALKKKLKVSLGTGTGRTRVIEEPNRISELSSVISGCEYNKDVKETVFKKFKKLSKVLKINQWKYADIVFGIHGKGYSGKHFFGTHIGYPSLNGKTRWKSPTEMFLKPGWNIQTKLDDRNPQLRLAITETIPIKEFIETTDINYIRMRKRNEKIKKILEKCDKVFVVGEKQGKYRTKFSIDIVKGKNRRIIQKSDSNAMHKIDKEMLKHGMKAGLYANVPGGEAFFTPESMDGVLVGDVVINIDRSYLLSKKNCIVWKFKKGKYKTVRAPAKIKKKMEKQYKDSKRLIREYERKKSLPKKIIEEYKKNFWRVGEFAINTNPKARLSRYLIVNEKIANMIHVAVGSGFEADRQSVYHWDMVVNCPEQKMDIYGVDLKGKEYWIIKKGKFVI